MKIAVAGMGYVGLSNAVLLARQHAVTVLDIVPEKVAMLNARQSPIRDVDIETALTQPLHLHATLDVCEAFAGICGRLRALAGADCVIVAAPTDSDIVICQFNTRAVESVIAQAIQYSPLSTIIVRSTVPAGFTRGMREKHGVDTILFMPEFLREGCALHDNLTHRVLWWAIPRRGAGRLLTYSLRLRMRSKCRGY